MATTLTSTECSKCGLTRHYYNLLRDDVTNTLTCVDCAELWRARRPWFVFYGSLFRQHRLTEWPGHIVTIRGDEVPVLVGAAR